MQVALEARELTKGLHQDGGSETWVQGHGLWSSFGGHGDCMRILQREKQALHTNFCRFDLGVSSFRVGRSGGVFPAPSDWSGGPAQVA